MNTYKVNIEGSAEKAIAIDLYLSESEDKRPLVIFAHGFKGFKDWGCHELIALYFYEQGLNFLKFNFSHSGISLHERDFFDDLDGFSKNTFSKELYDLDSVISYALSGTNFKAPDKIYLVGHSRGGGIAIVQSAQDKRIAKLATWASLSHFNHLWKSEQEENWCNQGKLSLLTGAPNKICP